MKKFIIAVLVLGVLFCSCQKNDAAVDKETINTAAPIPTVTTPITSETLNETDQQPIESDTVPPETSEPPLSPPPTEITTPTKMFVTINEACSSNKTCFKGSNGEHPDWIELYNNSDKAINLAGYGISDDKELPFRYTFSNYLIEAKSYVILLATGSVSYNKGVISLPFKLSSDGETIILTSPEGLCDILTVPPLREDTTYGRILDGGSIAAELTPTPLSTNNTATSTIKAPNPVFSHIGGFYSSAFELEISAGDGCSVYYTTDGSTPNSTSTIYNGPILLSDATSKQNVFSEIGPVSPNGFVTKNNQDKANIIRAIAFDENGNGSDIVSATYFVMEEERARPYENMPIISVYTDAHNLFDYEKGIYVSGKIYDEYMNGPDFDPETPTWLRPANYYLAGIAAERPATVEYFDAEHNIAFRQDVGIRIGGNASRANVQKSFKFYARSEYGKSYFDYPLFESGLEYDTFLLRSGANDMAKTKIRDVLTQSLIQDRGFATAKWQPCVMFLNGEYWGFYMMMERYDSDYFSDYYNIEKDDLVVIKTGNVDIGNPEDKEIYRDLRSFCKNNDLTLPENYEKLCSMIDIQSYIEYVAMNVIINNSDWPGNNTSLWRTREADLTGENPYADGRWRWASYDTERSMLLYGKGSAESFEKNTYDKLIKNGIIFKYVYKNESFRNQFVQTLADMLCYDFSYDRIDSYLTYFGENFEEQMRLNRLRYNTTSNYQKELDIIRGFWRERPAYILKYTAELFGLDSSETSEFILKINKEGAGQIKLWEHDVTLIDCHSILHVLDAPLILRAEAAQGYEFAGWAMADGTIKSTESSIEISLSDTDSITAIFEEKQ